MKKHTLVLSVVLLTVLGSFQDTQAMGGTRRFTQGLFARIQSDFKDIKDDKLKLAALATLATGYAILDATEKHLRQMRDQIDALEVQVQKQVLGLEGVTTK